MNGIDRPTVTVRGVHVRYRVNEDRESGFKELFSRGRVRSRKREVHAVRGVDLDVFEGETLGIVGTNGSGKSTLMAAMTGLLPVSEGEIHVRARPTLLGVSAALRPALSGRRNILIGCLALGLPLDEIKERSEEIAAFAGLEEFIDLPMRAYSSGMRARLNFSIATARIPEILLIDEALAVGDEQFRRRSQERLDEIRSSAGSVILVSHNLGEIETTCDRVAWLEKGELRLAGEPGEVVAAYLADVAPTESAPAMPAAADDESTSTEHGSVAAEDAPPVPGHTDATPSVLSEPEPHAEPTDDSANRPLGSRTAYVHIGLTDTGAGLFQRVVAQNPHSLAEAGLVVPQFLHQSNHSSLAAYASTDAAPLLDLPAGASYEDWRTVFRSTFIESTQVPGDLILSSEHVGVGLRPADIGEVPRLLLDAGYERIEVLMVVRPQHEMAALNHMTLVRNGRTAPFDVADHLAWRRRYDFEMIASRWDALDGVEAVHPVLYPTGPGMEEPVSVMFRLLGAGGALELPSEPDDDRLAVGPGALDYLRRLNARLDPADLPVPVDVVRALGGASPPRLPRGDAERLMAAFADSNAALLGRIPADRRVASYFDVPVDGPDADLDDGDIEGFATALIAYAADQRRRVRQQARGLG